MYTCMDDEEKKRKSNRTQTIEYEEVNRTNRKKNELCT